MLGCLLGGVPCGRSNLGATMKRLFLTTVTAAMATALVACGTGGGSGGETDSGAIVVPPPLANPSGFVAITFDDGPFPWTGRLLDILAEYQVSATFFLIGNNISGNRAQAQAIFEAGHDLANHSWTHPGAGLGAMTEAQVRDELTRTSDIIEGITGEAPVFFRAPNLDNGGSVLSVARELGMAVINADAVSRDWNDLTPDQIAANVRNATDGSIILLHEQWNSATVRTELAVPIIIRDLRLRNLEPVSLSELMERRGATLVPGTPYNRIN